MANLFYKDFLILAGADFDRLTGQWVPIASVTWGTDTGKHGVHFLTNLSARYATADEAVSYGLTAAKNWVDQGGQASFRFR